MSRLYAGLEVALSSVNRPDASAYPYLLETDAVNKPIDLFLLKQHLKVTTTSEDALLNLIIDAVTKFGEDYTWRDFITKTYTTRRHFFPRAFRLRKAVVQVINSIKYQKMGVETVVPTTVYFLTNATGFPRIELQLDQEWPDDEDRIAQTITIEFASGYGLVGTDVPGDIRMALLNHAAELYKSRGDCTDCSCQSTLPANAKVIYDQYRILETYAHA